MRNLIENGKTARKLMKNMSRMQIGWEKNRKQKIMGENTGNIGRLENTQREL